MKHIDMDTWDVLYKRFVTDITENGFSLEGALHGFIDEYEECRTQEDEPEDEEPLDLYFERKMTPIWDYVYNVQKQYTDLRTRVTKLEGASRPFGPTYPIGDAYPTYVGHPAGSPPQVPNTYKPAQPPLDWYKVTCANGNVPLGNNEQSKISPEEFDDWVEYVKNINNVK